MRFFQVHPSSLDPIGVRHPLLDGTKPFFSRPGGFNRAKWPTRTTPTLGCVRPTQSLPGDERPAVRHRKRSNPLMEVTAPANQIVHVPALSMQHFENFIGVHFVATLARNRIGPRQTGFVNLDLISTHITRHSESLLARSRLIRRNIRVHLQTDPLGNEPNRIDSTQLSHPCSASTPTYQDQIVLRPLICAAAVVAERLQHLKPVPLNVLYQLLRFI
jgi:hypothetical protein